MGTAVLETRFRGCSQGLLYNADRPHSALAGRTPDETYAIDREQEKLAA
jgi:transposase InsO family protein